MIRNCSMLSKCFGSNPFSVFSRNCHRNAIQFSWEKPEIGCTKLNFDGSSKPGISDASIGGVYRNHEGVFMLGFSERIGKATCLVAELVAAKRGLELALENGLWDIWIEGDSTSVMNFILKRSKLKSKEDSMHGEEINALNQQLNLINASHIYREGNKVADYFAGMGYKWELNKINIWRDVPPDKVSRFLQEDAEGQIISRNLSPVERIY